jgi:zinc protease
VKRRHLFAALVLAAIVSPYSQSRAQADTGTSSFDVNGLRVILRRNTANDVVAANVYLLGGVQQLSPATQGIESFLLASSERGTKKFPGETTRSLTARLGVTIVSEPTEDWTLFGFTGVRATFDSCFMILADRLIAPTLDSIEVERVRSRILTGLRLEANTPDPIINHLADSLAYVGHPYGFAPQGTEATIQSITPDQLRAYQKSQIVASRMLLVVVGNIERPRLEQLVQQTLGQLPRGNYAWSLPRPPGAPQKALLMQEAQLPTNYILGYYAGPSAQSPDYNALRVATAVLSGRFFTEIRSRRNLSYEVEAPFVERAIATGGVYVTTVAPDTTLAIMRNEIDRLQQELIDPRGLERLVQQFITDYFLKNETNSDQATFLARAQLYHGDYRAAARFVENLREVKPEDVRRVARQYMHDFRFVYLGNPSKLSRPLVDRF